MTLQVGKRLGPYEIVAPLGAGGMGEVYKATDTRLDRIVAIKILPEHLAESPERKARFEREAKTISQLNHPHVCTLHDVGSQDGIDFLVMEYIEGDTLGETLKRGSLPFDKALEYGIQIANGLDRAHRHGIVHRDLKPGNVMLTPSGVKLLDFGLAKLIEPETFDEGSDVETQQRDLTKPQAILGTLAYMAPEQLEAKEVDARTDLFAFGAVLYEMLTGVKAFQGETQASLISAIMSGEPEPVSAVRSMTPPALDHVVRTCLAKDPEERWQAAGDVARQLKWIGSGAAELGPGRVERKALTWAVPAVAAFVVGLAVGWLLLSKAPEPKRVSRLSIPLPPDQRISGNALVPMAFSPDGARIAYVGGAERRLYVRELDSFESTELSETDGADFPFFSPEGSWIGFFARRTLYKVAITGGSPVALADAPFGVGGSWGPNDEIVFGPSTNAGLQRVSANGGAPSQLTTLGTGVSSHSLPQHLPGGNDVLFSVVGPRWSASVVSLASGEKHPILTGDEAGNARREGAVKYISRHLVSSQPGNRAVLASVFDPDSFAVGDELVAVLDGVHVAHAVGRLALSASETGSLAYVPAVEASRSLLWVDRQGRSRPLEGSVLARVSSISVSPNGRYAAVREDDSIRVVDLERGTGTILAGLEGGRRFQTPIWTADGSRVTFSCNVTQDWDICQTPRTGGETEVFLTREGNQVPLSWSPDGELLVGEIRGTDVDVWIRSADGELTPLLSGTANEAAAEFSPDGRWIVYGSNETGRDEIFVRSYPEGTTFERVSDQGGTAPRWSADGDEIFYRNGSRLMAVTVMTEPELRLGGPRVLFEQPYAQNPYVTLDEQPAYDVMPDGETFLMVADRSIDEIRVILNWDEELKRLIPRD